MNARLQELLTIGQSIWYDNLSREVLEDGSLAALINNGVRGLTSNPTIFQKAIAGSNDYDESLAALKGEYPNASSDELCERLMIADVAAAADLLLPLYNESKGEDGFASIEVSPTLAHDTKGTIEAAKRIWAALDRPNIMIKIPATKEGVPALEAVLAEGINVNVTLIFSVARYKEVVDAYLSALQTRVDAGHDVSALRSVASFFVSRVDAAVEKQLAALQGEGKVSSEQFAAVIGKIGVANSVMAYQAYHEAVAADTFATLQAKGAVMQRPLWASTGTKNADFDPLLYVKALAVPNTVNTLPPATLEKLMADDNGLASQYEQFESEALQVMATLAEVGVDMEEVLATLESDGVTSFAASYEDLVSSVGAKL